MTGTRHSFFKTIFMAFSALFVRSFAVTIFSYIFDDSLQVKVAALIFTGVLGILYLTVVADDEVSILYDPPDRKTLIISVLTILSFVVASSFTGNLIFAISDTTSSVTNVTAFSLFASVLVSPFAEEVMYRGFLYKQLTSFGKKRALIISAVIFALSHGTIAHLYTGFIGGLILACIYDKTKKLRYSMLAHILFNGITLLLNALLNALFVPDMTVICIAAAIANIILIMMLVKLFTLQGASPIQKANTKRPIVTNNETKRIVNEVMEEYKQSKARR